MALNDVQVHQTDVPSASNAKQPAANTAATVTFAADTTHRHVLSWVGWSYDGDPTGGKLTITRGASAKVFEVDITKGGPGYLMLPEIPSQMNEAMTVTLAAGGGGISGKLNVYGRRLLVTANGAVTLAS